MSLIYTDQCLKKLLLRTKCANNNFFHLVIHLYFKKNFKWTVTNYTCHFHVMFENRNIFIFFSKHLCYDHILHYISEHSFGTLLDLFYIFFFCFCNCEFMAFSSILDRHFREFSWCVHIIHASATPLTSWT